MATVHDISAADEAILPQRPRLLAEDPPRRAVVSRWLVRALVVLVLSLFGGVVWLAYQEATGGGEPPLIRAEAGPYKRAPDAAGKPAVEADDWTMASNAFGDHQPAQRPEVILPRAAPGPRNIAEADPSLVAPPPPSVTAPIVAPPASLPDVVELPPPAGVPAAAPRVGSIAPRTEPPMQQLAAIEPAAGAASTAAGAPVAMPSQPTVTATPVPAPRPAARPQQAAPVAVAAVEQRPATPPPAAKSPPVTASAGSDGNWAIQLAALSSRDAVDRAWAQMRAQSPVLASLSLRVAEIKISSGRLYRLQAGTFADRDAAARACVALKAQGKDCMVVAAAR